jgi:hypothetical protein
VLRLRLLSVGASLGALFSVGAICDAFYTVSGRVESCATRTPIPGAKVQLKITDPRRSGAAETLPDGTFTVAVNALPDDSMPSELTVSKDGFATSALHVTKPAAPQAICLEANTPAGAPAPDR